jgi:hypothetical protein
MDKEAGGKSGEVHECRERQSSHAVGLKIAEKCTGVERGQKGWFGCLV